MNRQYYYLISSIPEAVFDVESNALPFMKYKEYVMEYIHPQDYKWVDMLFYPIDNRNLLNLLYPPDNLKWEEGGKFSLQEMEEALAEKKLPRYILSFLQAKEDAETRNEPFDRLTAERQLFNYFYSDIHNCKNKFISEWFNFDREVRNIQAAFAARKLNVPIEEDIFTNNDDLTEQILRSKATEFGLSKERDYIPELFHILETKNILERESKLDVFRWKQIENLTIFDYFTIDAVLAFLQRCYILNRWSIIDNIKGEEIFRNLVNELKATYKH